MGRVVSNRFPSDFRKLSGKVATFRGKRATSRGGAVIVIGKSPFTVFVGGHPNWYLSIWREFVVFPFMGTLKWQLSWLPLGGPSRTTYALYIDSKTQSVAAWLVVRG